jgi:hypothetical protein
LSFAAVCGKAKKGEVEPTCQRWGSMALNSNSERRYCVAEPKRPLTPVYILFYILLSEDSWRILFGLASSFFLAPRLLVDKNFGIWGETMAYFMLMVIGWCIFAYPAKKITGFLKQWVHRQAGRT